MRKLVISELSDLQKRKLVSGKKVRVKKPIKGKGVLAIIVDPTKYNMVSRTFDKDKALEIDLSPEELEQTAMAEMEGDIISGRGIFGKRVDKWLKKKGIMKVIDKIAKPVKKVLFKAMDIGTKVGKDALMKSKYGVAAVPALDYANRISQSYIDKPTEFQKNYKQKLLKSAGQTAEQMVKDVVENVTDNLAEQEKAMKEAEVEGKGLMISGGMIVKYRPIYNYGDKPNWVNPNFMYRTMTPSIYYKV